jgi:hypothetical protein
LIKNAFLISVIGDYKNAYPEAKVIGVKDLAEKVKAKGLKLDGGKFRMGAHKTNPLTDDIGSIWN